MQPATVSCDDGKLSMTVTAMPAVRANQDLTNRYQSLLDEPQLVWIENHRILRCLGSGGQGTVFLCERIGADQFRLPVAVKVFSPERFENAPAYDEAMSCMAQVAVRVAQIQQDNLIDVHNFVELNRIRLMEMEWVQ